MFRKKLVMIPLVCMLIFSACVANSPQEPVASEQQTDTAISEEQITNNISAYYKYLRFASETSITATNWDNPSEIPADRLIKFFSNKTNLAMLSTDANMITIPAPIVERYIQLYFNVESNYIKQSEYYNAQSNDYFIPIPSGGPSSVKVVDIEEKDNIVTIAYEYYSPTDEITVIRTGTLTVKTDQTDFKYLRNETTEIDA